MEDQRRGRASCPIPRACTSGRVGGKNPSFFPSGESIPTCRDYVEHFWAGGWEDKIKADLDVSIVGGYTPSPYSSGAYYYEGVKPADLAGWDSQVMPATAKLAGVDDPATARRRASALEHRPKLRAQLAREYPELYGPNAKLPAEKPRKRKK